jgi:hypothetical protein
MMVQEQGANGARPASARALQALVIALGTATLAVPPLVLATVGTAGTPPALSAVRFLGMLAFTLIFMQIITGALRRPMERLFPPDLVNRFHNVTGVTGFTLAFVHGMLVLAYGFEKSFSLAWVIGPVALTLLAVAIAAALEMRRLGTVWWWIHRLNYGIFVAIFIKVMLIGTDKTSLGLRVAFSAYVAIAAIALVYRVVELSRAGKGVSGR